MLTMVPGGPGAQLAVEVHEVGDHWSPHVDEDGGRLPLVLLNPGVGDRRCWHRVVPTWSTTRRVVTYDQRGAGESQWEPEAPDDRVADALAVLDAVEVERAVLVGNSIGGALALDLALDHPGRVAGLVLVAPYVTGAPPPDLDDPDLCPPEVLALDEAADAAGEAGDLDEVVRLLTQLWLDGWQAAGPRVDPQARALFSEMVHRIEGAPATAGGPDREPAWPRLSQVAVPTLVVAGGLDLPYVNRRGEHVANEVPHGEHVELDRAAHLPQLEAHLRFLAATRDFLDRVP